jgi:hypothetical protein
LTPHYVRIAPGDSFPDITKYSPFSTVVILGAEYRSDWPSEVNRWLLQSGCRYVMAWGPECEAWHDNVDRVNIDDHSLAEIPDDKFVMTTWHDNESLESVFWYAQFCAEFTYDDVELNQAVLLDISPTDHEPEFLMLWEQAKTLADREDGDG